jgi:hypothetical protein
VVAGLPTPRGSADQHLADHGYAHLFSGLYVNAVAGEGDFYAGRWSSCSTFPAQAGLGVTFQSSPQVCRLAGGLVTGILVPRTSSQQWGEGKTNSIGLRAGWVRVWDLQPSSAAVLSQLTKISACVCVWIGSRAQTLHARRTRGLSASLEVEVEGEWSEPGLMSCRELFCRAHLFGGVAADIGIGSAWPGPGPRRRRLGKVGRGGTGTGMG